MSEGNIQYTDEKWIESVSSSHIANKVRIYVQIWEPILKVVPPIFLSTPGEMEVNSCFVVKLYMGMYAVAWYNDVTKICKPVNTSLM